MLRKFRTAQSPVKENRGFEAGVLDIDVAPPSPGGAKPGSPVTPTFRKIRLGGGVRNGADRQTPIGGMITSPISLEHRVHAETNGSDVSGHGLTDEMKRAIRLRLRDGDEETPPVLGDIKNVEEVVVFPSTTPDAPPPSKTAPMSSLNRRPPPHPAAQRSPAGTAHGSVGSVDDSFFSAASNDLDASMLRMSIPPEDPIFVNAHPESAYMNLKVIGSGANGTVYSAEARDGSGKKVALKKVEYPLDWKVKQLLEAEIRLMCCTRHPNLVKCHETFRHRGNMYIAMELMKVGSLTNVIQFLQHKRKRMNESQIAGILKQVLQGLDALHSTRRLHRDIKSDNVLVDIESGNPQRVRIKMADFGYVAELTDVRSKRNTRVGTPYWMAPELIECKDYDYKADIWSVGVLAYECAEWEPPFFGEKPPRAMELVRSCPPSKLPQNHGWSPEFESFINQCLMRSPGMRPSAAKLLQHHKFLEKACPREELYPLFKLTYKWLQDKAAKKAAALAAKQILK